MTTYDLTMLVIAVASVTVATLSMLLGIAGLLWEIRKARRQEKK